MNQSSGFFISQGGDRRYTPDWLASYIKALVTTGVYKDECGVTAADGMAVTVAPGRAWIEGYLYLLDTPHTLQISNADGVLGRIDIVVLRLDLTARAIEVHVVTGTPGALPEAPALTRNSDVYELELAEISVPAGTISVTQELIRDTRLDDTVCGVTVSAVQHIPTASFLSQMLAEFNTWFDEVKGILGEDEAGKLLQMVQAAAPPPGSIFWYAAETAPDGYLICDGAEISRTDYARLFSAIGTAFGEGDGETTFSLPDLRAKFIRGAGSSGGYTATFKVTQDASNEIRDTKGSILNNTKLTGSDKTIISSNVDYGYPNSGGSYVRAGSYSRMYFRPYNIALTPIIKY